MFRTAKSLEGCNLQARDGSIGSVKDVYFDDERWHVRYLVVNAGNWLTGRQVLIASAALTGRNWDERSLDVELTKEQVKNSPPVDTERPVSRQQEIDLHRYYAWPYYWTAPAMGGAYAAPISPAAAPVAAEVRNQNTPAEPAFGEGEARSSAAIEAQRAAEGDIHLRSAHAVRGYHIEASDGSIGHVEDFLVDDASWAVRYLVVDTRNWWPGKKVIVPPSSIQGIDWLSRTVRVDLTRDAIKSGPEFNPGGTLTSEYTDRLEAHYGRFRGAAAKSTPKKSPRRGKV